MEPNFQTATGPTTPDDLRPAEHELPTKIRMDVGVLPREPLAANPPAEKSLGEIAYQEYEWLCPWDANPDAHKSWHRVAAAVAAEALRRADVEGLKLLLIEAQKALENSADANFAGADKIKQLEADIERLKQELDDITGVALAECDVSNQLKSEIERLKFPSLTMRRWQCTCVGTCRGEEGLGPNWYCALKENERLVAHETDPASDKPTCPDCGRSKAKCADDIVLGCCPKWYAVRDQSAEDDCVLTVQRRGRAPAGELPQSSNAIRQYILSGAEFFGEQYKEEAVRLQREGRRFQYQQVGCTGWEEADGWFFDSDDGSLYRVVSDRRTDSKESLSSKPPQSWIFGRDEFDLLVRALRRITWSHLEARRCVDEFEDFVVRRNRQETDHDA